MKRTHRFPGSGQSGRSLIELMIATTVSLIVLGAVMNSVVGTSSASRTQDNLARLTEDAQIALNLITGHLRMGGYSRPRLNALPGSPFSNYDGAAIRGCSNEFVDVAEPDLASVACVAGTGPNAFAIAYEADALNTLAMGAGNDEPTDCLGRILPVQASPIAGNFTVAENRFFIRNNAAGEPELACAGNGGVGFGAAQTLVSNVENLRLDYGVTETVIGPWGNNEFAGRVSRYLSAAQLDATFAVEPVLTRWSRVSSVRVCLLMRTDDRVTDVATPYLACDGTTVTPTDRRLRVAVSSTVNLRNNSAVQ